MSINTEHDLFQQSTSQIMTEMFVLFYDHFKPKKKQKPLQGKAYMCEYSNTNWVA